MARTTAYPASIAARLLLGKAIKDKGLVPVEKIGMHNELFRTFIDELEKRNVKVTEEKSIG
jgi:saccharopine dehydrogenase-like NADP-dependent oxidoreductase